MTELHAGESLAAHLETGPLPLDEAVRMALSIATALEAEHGAGRIHHNLKPGNILFTANGVKLLESGAPIPPDVAAVIHAATAAGGHHADDNLPAERLRYLTPEQVEGQPVDARTDVFALGSVLYEMVTGKKAFDANSPGGIVTAILFLDPPVISMHLANAPPALETVIRRALEKAPDRRFPSISELRRHLERCLSAPNPGPAPAAASPPAPDSALDKSRPGSVPYLAAIAVIAALVLVWLFFR